MNMLSILSDIQLLTKIFESTAAIVIVACAVIVIVYTFIKIVLPKFKEVNEAVKTLKQSFHELKVELIEMHSELESLRSNTDIRLVEHNKESEKTFEYMVSYMSEMKATQLSITENMKHIAEIVYTLKAEHDIISKYCINLSEK